MSLRESISEAHDRAEAHPLTAEIMQGVLATEAYIDMLANCSAVYAAVEDAAAKRGLLEGLDDLPRADKIDFDLLELIAATGYAPHIFQCSADHVEHINSLDDTGVLANMYVLHMGDMYGGQVLKSKLPGPNTRFEFEDRGALVTALRSKLHDGLADEANDAFSRVLDLFDAIAARHDIRAA